MDARERRALVFFLLLLVVAVLAVPRLGPAGAERRMGDSGSLGVTAEVRRAGLRFGAGVSEADRAWILAAISAARPEARRLIAEIDGLVTVQTHTNLGDTMGFAQGAPDGAIVSVDTAALNGDRALDRNVVVLHELGHVIDWVLVPDELVRELDGGIPRGGPCRSATEHIGACTAIEERFADTFAKWALFGAVSMAGSGYGIPTPASLEDWGTPLGLMAARLTVEAGS